MRKAFVFFVLLIGVSLLASASLRITDFAAQIVLDEEGTLHVEERLDVDFYSPHHGIERWIPVSYQRFTGENITISLKVISATQDEGSVQYTTRRSGRNILVRIGDPDRTITGTHTYTLSYTVDRALLFRDDYIQLYWNVTGNEWAIPIDRASATITLPQTVTTADVMTTSYVGYYGSNARGKETTIDDQGRFVFTAGPLMPGEGLTIDLAIPRDQ
ncbi:DUF2207 domain-containing protein, partial [Candidatus Bipolaricaulota bacterium]|nr:DUF2207 domain-containing protein [Candidatus Bipolaricaulota bacterium]